MVSTVRCASVTARLATSVEVAACPAISPIEAASSSAEAGGRGDVRRGRADALLGGARLGRDRVGRAVERRGGGFQPLARRRAPWPSASSIDLLEARDGRRDRLGAALALAHRLLLRHGELLALERVVAEHDHGARHRADLVLGVGRGDVHRRVAGRELLHRAGQAAERLGDAAADQPVQQQAEQTRRAMPIAMISILVRACEAATPSAACGCACARPTR